MDFLTYNTRRWVNSTFLLIVALYAFGFQREWLDMKFGIPIIAIAGFYGFFFVFQIIKGGTKSFQTYGNAAFVATMSLYAIGFQWLRVFLDQKIVGDITPLMALGAYSLYLMYEVWKNK